MLGYCLTVTSCKLIYKGGPKIKLRTETVNFLVETATEIAVFI